MVTEKVVRLIFLSLLFFAILIFELAGGIIDFLSNLMKSDLRYYSIFEIGRYLASFLIVIASLKWKWVIGLTGTPFVAGKYRGSSEERGANNEVIEKQIETFEITQSLLSTSISGISKTEEDGFYSTWKGKLIEQDGNHFRFLVEIETYEQTYFGTLLHMAPIWQFSLVQNRSQIADHIFENIYFAHQNTKSLAKNGVDQGFDLSPIVHLRLPGFWASPIK